MNEVVPSLSDIAAVTNAGRNNSGFGFGGDYAWIILLVILLWGGNGFGNGFGGSNGINPNYVTGSDSAFISRQIDSDTAGIERKLDYVQEQICNSDSTRANQIATVQSSLMNGFADTALGISNNRYENQLATSTAQAAITAGITDLGTQLQSCCCQNRYDNLVNSNALQAQLADNRYADAMNTNLLNNAIATGFCQQGYNDQTNTRDIIQSMNDGFKALSDEILANRMEDLRNQNAELRTALNNANLAASQARQTNQIIDALEPKLPVPAFSVPNPFNYNNGYGCNCGYNM